MTEAFVEKILSKRESNDLPFVSGLTLKRTQKDNNLTNLARNTLSSISRG